jgi:hypothetical protein
MYLRRYRTAIKPPSSWLGTTKCVCGNWFSSQNIAAIGRCRNKYLSGTRAKIAKRINAPIHLAFYYLPNLEIELRLATDDLWYLPWILCVSTNLEASHSKCYPRFWISSWSQGCPIARSWRDPTFITRVRHERRTTWVWVHKCMIPTHIWF